MCLRLKVFLLTERKNSKLWKVHNKRTFSTNRQKRNLSNHSLTLTSIVNTSVVKILSKLVNIISINILLY